MFEWNRQEFTRVIMLPRIFTIKGFRNSITILWYWNAAKCFSGLKAQFILLSWLMCFLHNASLLHKCELKGENFHGNLFLFLYKSLMQNNIWILMWSFLSILKLDFLQGSFCLKIFIKKHSKRRKTLSIPTNQHVPTSWEFSF